MTQQTDVLGSALGHAIREQMFTSSTNSGEAVSAVNLLSKLHFYREAWERHHSHWSGVIKNCELPLPERV